MYWLLEVRSLQACVHARTARLNGDAVPEDVLCAATDQRRLLRPILRHALTTALVHILAGALGVLQITPMVVTAASRQCDIACSVWCPPCAESQMLWSPRIQHPCTLWRLRAATMHAPCSDNHHETNGILFCSGMIGGRMTAVPSPCGCARQCLQQQLIMKAGVPDRGLQSRSSRA